MSEIVVVVTDPLDGTVVEHWAGELAAAADRGPQRLVADLTDCAWIDAAAIVALLGLHARMLRANGRFVLRRPPARVRRTLRLARVDQVLEVEEAGLLASGALASGALAAGALAAGALAAGALAAGALADVR